MDEMMKTQELPEGPWLDEPNRKEFMHSGLNCLILRSPMGSLNGYVGVGKDHPFYGIWYGGCVKGCPPKAPFEAKPGELGYAFLSSKTFQEWEKTHRRCEEFSHSPESMLHVHGGLTYSDFARKEIHIPSSNDALWFFGFDCAHFNDLVPGLLEIAGRKTEFQVGNVYRDMVYVEDQTRKLADQLFMIKDLPR